LAANGIRSDFVTVTAKDTSRVPILSLVFLVKNWTFEGVGTLSDPIYKWKFTSASTSDYMVPAPAGGVYGELTSIGGVPGQNSPTPSEKVFSNQALIRYPSGTGTYYDPSYGKTYVDQAGFQTNATDGFCAGTLDPLILACQHTPFSSPVLILFDGK
jgi:hypothetical protein